MALKVFDLQCQLGHVFEGWFGTRDSFDSQIAQGLLTCPVCNSSHITKKLSAARLNIGQFRDDRDQHPEGAGAPASKAASAGAAGSASTVSASHAVAAPAAGQLAQLQAKVMQQLRHIVRNTDNVGVRFAEEARRMHEGEIEERAIRGTATPQERKELAEEGIAILPIPDYLNDDRLQ